MNHWFLLVQLGVGGFGALLFLNAMADAFKHEKHLLNIRKLQGQQEPVDEVGVVMEIDPRPEAIPVHPAS